MGVDWDFLLNDPLIEQFGEWFDVETTHQQRLCIMAIFDRPSMPIDMGGQVSFTTLEPTLFVRKSDYHAPSTGDQITRRSTGDVFEVREIEQDVLGSAINLHLHQIRSGIQFQD